MIRNKKQRLAQLLFGANDIAERVLARRTSDRLLVLAYHRICDLPGDRYPFQHEIISATPDEFDRQLEFLGRHFNVTNFHGLSEALDDGTTIPDDSVVITFDDGYADNYYTALPILDSHGLTATVYVSTGFIDAQKPFWFELLSYYVMRMRPGPLSLNRGNFRLELTNTNRRAVRKSIGQALRAVSDSTRHCILEELQQQSGVEPSDEELDLVRPLTWDQIRELHGAGIEIGSHTVSHPFLVQLDEPQIVQELATSKARIEDETGGPVTSLSYPTGGSQYFDARSVRIASDCGYRFAVSYDHATARTTELRPFEIPRIHVEPDVSLALFKANMMLPRIFVR